MQDDNELHAQELLTVQAFTKWAYANTPTARILGIENLRHDVLNVELKKYLKEHGFSEDTPLIDGHYIKCLTIES